MESAGIMSTAPERHDHIFKTTLAPDTFDAIVLRSCRAAFEIRVEAQDPTLIPPLRLVNVSFDSGTGPKYLRGVADADACTAEGGWYYDVKPAEGTPKRIVACPTTCTQFQQTDMGSVQIKLGCQTRVK